MRNWKKTLVAAGILATVLAGSALAATEAEDAATQQNGLEYNNKIEQKAPEVKKGHHHVGIDKDKHGHRHDGKVCGPKDGHRHEGKHHGPKHHKDGSFHGHHGEKAERPGKLTPEQRQQLAKEREEFFANWSTMSDRERYETTERFISRVNEERMKNMTEEEKKAFEKKQAAKKAEREKIAKMTDDERHDYFQKKHDEMVKERTKNMTKEEKERFLERDKRQQERMDEFWKKWKAMTPEEKEQWKQKHHRFGPGQGMPGPKGPGGPRRGPGPAGPRPDAPAEAVPAEKA